MILEILGVFISSSSGFVYVCKMNGWKKGIIHGVWRGRFHVIC